MALSIIIVLALSCLHITVGRTIGDGPENTLVLVHAIFRHGNRTPDNNIYPGNPYGNESFYKPYGYAQLTNEGKRTSYQLGQTFRDRYKDFLKEEYNVKLVDARATDVYRTKTSLMLVLSALFPPTESLRWNKSLNWQPISFSANRDDKVMSARFQCSNYKKTLNERLRSKEIRNLLSKYQEVFKDLSNHANHNISSPKDVADLYIEFTAQKGCGYPLPNWSDKYFPETMATITKDWYYLMTNTTELKKIISGYLIEKIVNDSKSKIDKTLIPQERQMFIYSTHEKTMATFLITLGIYDSSVPTYCSYILVELHNINGIYGYKIYYQNYDRHDPIPMTIPGCGEFCPVDKFMELVKKYIPTDADCQTLKF